MASLLKSPSSISLLLLFLTLLSQINHSLSIRPAEIKPKSPSNLVFLKSNADIFEILPKFGLPKGLLPNKVKSFTLSDDGSFQVELLSTCYVQFDDLVYYDRKIKGKLSYGSISDVSGIQAKKLFLWLPVTGIQADVGSGTVEFYVGALSEKLPAKQFEDIPVCKSKACQGSNAEAI